MDLATWGCAKKTRNGRGEVLQRSGDLCVAGSTLKRVMHDTDIPRRNSFEYHRGEYTIFPPLMVAVVFEMGVQIKISPVVL